MGGGGVCAAAGTARSSASTIRVRFIRRFYFQENPEKLEHPENLENPENLDMW
jgi:hypothetical protein